MLQKIMALPYLTRRGDTFAFRIAVPDDLRPLLHVREIVRSLKTQTRQVAAPRALALASQVLQLFSELRDMAKRDDKDGIQIDFGFKINMNQFGFKTAEATDVKPGEAAEAVEAVLRLQQRLDQDQPQVPVAAAWPTPSLAVMSVTTPSLNEAIRDFLKGQHGASESWRGKLAITLGMYLELAGDVPLQDLKQATISEMFELICRLPNQWKSIQKRDGVSVREIAEQEHRGPLVAPATFTNQHKACMTAFINWARAKYTDQGFPPGLSLDKVEYRGTRKRGENKQRAFTLDELKRLFEGPEMAAIAADSTQHHKFWLPAICVFTGARIGEVCQLNPQTDIRQDGEGIWHFILSEDTEAADGVRKAIKTKTTRLVPMHAKLIELGFLGYLERVKATGSKSIFPAWKPVRGRAGRQPGDWFGDFLRDIGLHGVENNLGKALLGAHAFRHTMLSHGQAQGLNLTALTHATPKIDGVSPVAQGYMDPTIVSSLSRLKNDLDKLDYGIEFPVLAR
ncbi:hypothetical protein LLG90_07985 [Aromatoleum toluclasticum]|uniref:DUF6538 domain-containing protein n=1 Tax=Aromatoleum toluclasticum TaxID=92003 RepID=UPI001D17F20B|nr:DUF6538 domain-containing protein [Aromatoleum toluclasticum]MCC4115285.1 hypothetical protein [Aromatoleum toluclasticum]